MSRGRALRRLAQLWCPQVRSLWAAVDEMLSSIRAEQEAVESVLQGQVDQHVLDGTDRVLAVPRSLQARVEQLPHQVRAIPAAAAVAFSDPPPQPPGAPQLSSGRVYEGGQLDLLCLLELTNHSLQLLAEERRRLPVGPSPDVGAARLQETRGRMWRALQSLQLLRYLCRRHAAAGPCSVF